jgi:hypothetical protein
MAGRIEPADWQAYVVAANWLASSMTSVFLQDANSLIVKPSDLVQILEHLTRRFPEVKRITSYARAHTLARMNGNDLRAIREAGLNRIHTGLESGSDRVLESVKKGATADMHVKAGLKVKDAGIELSEYYMPGLGGRALWEEHALRTAEVLNRINPDFIRLRTLAIAERTPLFADQEAGRFERSTDLEVAKELLLFIQNLDGITSIVKSDHILNLFGDLEGILPRDKERMISILRAFLAMTPEHQALYQVGRRLGIFHSLDDMQDTARLANAERACRELAVTADNLDAITDRVTGSFI